MMWGGISDLVLGIALVISVVTDLRERLIYNKVVFPVTGAVMLIHIINGGISGFGLSMAGWATGIGLLLIPYFMGGMGAGDVKLLGLVGAAKGTMFVLSTALYMALVGGLLAMGILVFRKGFVVRMERLAYGLYAWRYGTRIPLVTKESFTGTYPYGVAIATGALLCYGLGGWGGG
jgi:prepilin peptidase CpaA